MAYGNELDDDLTPDSIEYKTVDAVYDFVLPSSGFSTETQRKWAETISREVTRLRRENRVVKSQLGNAVTLANAASNQVGTLTQADSVVNTVAVNAPSQPIVTSRMGSLEIRWDGTDLDGLPMGKGFSHVNAYAVKTSDLPPSPNFDLDEIYSDDTLPEEAEPRARTEWPPMPIGSLTSNSDGSVLVLTDLEYNTEYTIWFIAVDIRGLRSPAGEVISASVQPLVNTDVIGRIIDGANIVLGSIDENLFDDDFKDRLTSIEQGVEDAQTSADGKNSIWYRPTTNPPPTPNKVGDTWFVTNLGNSIREWDGTQWSNRALDTNAIADLAITNAKIGNLDAAKITTGSLSADRIAAESITGAKIAANTITAYNIAALTITADEIAGNTITGAKIAALTIEADNIATNAIVADKIDAGAVTGVKISATAIDGKTITGALIRTAASGLRVQLDTVGLRTFNASGAETSRLAANAGGLFLTGTLVNSSNTTGNNPTATLTSGSLTFNTPNSPGAGSVTLSVGGMTFTGAGVPFQIAHSSGGLNSDISIFASGQGNLLLGAGNSGTLSLSGGTIMFPDDAIGMITPAAGMPVHTVHMASLRRIKDMCYLNYTFQFNGGNITTTIGTVPVGFRPAKDTFAGVVKASSAGYGNLFVRASGVMAIEYFAGSVPAGSYIPIAAVWQINEQ